MRIGASVLIHVLLVTPSSGATAETFTISDALSAERSARAAHGAVTSARSRYVTWIESGSLRVAAEPDFKPRTLIEQGNGAPLTAVYASADERTIFFLRGSEQPAFGATKVQDRRELWQVDMLRGVPQLIAHGDDVPEGALEGTDFGGYARPELSFAPDGRAVAFAEGPILYELRRAASGDWQRRQLLQPKAEHLASVGIAAIAYSPDGTQIAFVSERKARQSYVAIHDIARSETCYLQPGLFRDGSPVWSPDGTEVAFVRDPGNWTLTYRFTPRREGVPWSILSADANTCAVRTVWTADRGPGSVARTFTPIWTTDGRILFSWEKTGWNLVYAVASRGGAPVLLTPGEGEVSDPVLSPDGYTLIYEANIGDPARRHLWSLNLKSGGAPRALTSGAGVERSPQFTAGGYLTYKVDYRKDGPPQRMIRSSHGTTSALALLSQNESRKLRSLWTQFQPVDVVSSSSEDGLRSWHILVKPRTPPPAGGYPVVVQAHGGPAVQTLPGGWRFAFGQYLASRGYLYIDINYRGSTGFGLDYRLAEGAGAAGGSEVKDLAALVQYLKRRGDVNPTRVGIMGGSYGGHLVSLAMSRLPDDFAAGVSQFGVADWVVEMKKDQADQGGMSAPPDYIRLSERMRIEELAYESSATSRIANWRGPVLFTVGEMDRAGHMESAIDLGYRLMARGVPVEFFVEPSGAHDVLAYPQVFDFFERHLK